MQGSASHAGCTPHVEAACLYHRTHQKAKQSVATRLQAHQGYCCACLQLARRLYGRMFGYQFEAQHNAFVNCSCQSRAIRAIRAQLAQMSMIRETSA